MTVFTFQQWSAVTSSSETRWWKSQWDSVDVSLTPTPPSSSSLASRVDIIIIFVLATRQRTARSNVTLEPSFKALSWRDARQQRIVCCRRPQRVSARCVFRVLAAAAATDDAMPPLSNEYWLTFVLAANASKSSVLIMTTLVVLCHRLSQADVNTYRAMKVHR